MQQLNTKETGTKKTKCHFCKPIAGFILCFSGVYLVFDKHINSMDAVYVLIALGLVFLFFDQLTEFEFFGLKAKINQKINELEKIQNDLAKVKENLINETIKASALFLLYDIYSPDGIWRKSFDSVGDFKMTYQNWFQKRKEILVSLDTNKPGSRNIIQRVDMVLMFHLLEQLELDNKEINELAEMLQNKVGYDSFAEKIEALLQLQDVTSKLDELKQEDIYIVVRKILDFHAGKNNEIDLAVYLPIQK